MPSYVWGPVCIYYLISTFFDIDHNVLPCNTIVVNTLYTCFKHLMLEDQGRSFDMVHEKRNKIGAKMVVTCVAC